MVPKNFSRTINRQFQLKKQMQISLQSFAVCIRDRHRPMQLVLYAKDLLKAFGHSDVYMFEYYMSLLQPSDVLDDRYISFRP